MCSTNAYDRLAKVVHAIFSRFIKPDVIDGKVESQLSQIELDDSLNYMIKLDVGTPTRIHLDGLLMNKSISSDEYKSFYDRCKKS